MNFKKNLCLKLLNYKNLIEKKYKKDFREYDLKKYYNLQYQLTCIKDFFVWKKSFSWVLLLNALYIVLFYFLMQSYA